MSASNRIVGRHAELAAIDRFLEVVKTGARALAIEGEAGIGKTVLWRHAVDEARRRGLRVLVSRSASSETKHSYVGLTDLAGGLEAGALEHLPAPQRHALDVALLRAHPGPASPDPRTIATAFLSVLRHVAGSASTLVAIDDAQWMDSPSARALEFAVRRLESLPIGIVVAVRTGVHAPALEGVAVEHVEVGPLSVGALHDVIESQLGANLSRSTLVKVRATSAGNPFYALEIARSLGGDHHAGRSVSVPGSLRELVRDRFTGLTPSVDAVLHTIAAAPRPTEQLVAKVAGRGSRTALRTALERGLIERSGDVLSFTHPLLGAVAYERAGDDRRRELHARLGELADDPEERARHLALAATQPDERLAALLDEGARAARVRGAPDAAAELADEALRLTGGTNERRAIDAADHHFAAGSSARARELLESVIADDAARGLRAEALLRLAVIRHHLDDHAAAVELLERALVEAGDDAALRSEIEQHLSWAVCVLGDIPRGGEHAMAALALAEQRADGPAVSRALAMVAVIDFLLGRGVRHDMIRRSLEHEDWDGPLPVQWRPSFVHGYILKITGELDAARDVLEGVRDRLAERGDETALPWILFHLSELEFIAGRWDQAERHAQRGHEIASQAAQQLMVAFQLSALAYVEGSRGRVDRARALAGTGLELAMEGGLVPAIQFNTSALAFVDLSDGNAASVHERLGPLADMLASVGLAEVGVLRFLPDEVEALIALGDPERAHALLEPFERRAKELDRGWAMAAAARCRALLESAAGNAGAAVSAAEQALAAHEHLGQPFERGRALLAAGRVYRRAKRKGAAKEALEQAVSVFEELGAPGWSAAARAELGRVGLRPPAPGTLTETERRVAELAASGMTNREVADAAFISPRSVEGVLARVYRKLGIRSRAELGTRISELR